MINRKKRNSQRQGSTDTLVYKPSLRTGYLPFPSRFLTRMCIEADMKVAAATATITSGYCWANVLDRPFYNIGGSVATFPSYTHLGPATAATLQFTGATSLFNSTLFQFYKITRSMIQVRVDPGPANADLEVLVLPSISSAAPSTIYTARTQKYVKTAKFSSTGNAQGVSSNGFLTSQVSSAQGLGYSASEVKNDIYAEVGQFGVVLPTSGFVWQVWLQTCDANVTVGAALLRVRLEVDVECMLHASALPTT
jgi:hypothetical protein